MTSTERTSALGRDEAAEQRSAPQNPTKEGPWADETTDPRNDLHIRATKEGSES